MVMLCEKIDKVDLPLFLTAVPKNQWIAEVKYDGDRVRLKFDNGKPCLLNRRGSNVTLTYPEIQDVTVSCEQAFFDGEMCVLNDDGVSLFNEGIAFRSHCKNADSIKQAMLNYPVTYIIFDILELNGKNLRNLPFSERRQILESIKFSGNVKLSEVFKDIKDAWDIVEQRKEEGLILKHLSSLYREGYRSSNWRKVKNIKEVDLKFTKFEQNPQGITVENEEGIRCLVAGRHQHEVKEALNKYGSVVLTIRHLGQTATGKYRQPTYAKMVVEG